MYLTIVEQFFYTETYLGGLFSLLMRVQSVTILEHIKRYFCHILYRERGATTGQFCIGRGHEDGLRRQKEARFGRCRPFSCLQQVLGGKIVF